MVHFPLSINHFQWPVIQFVIASLTATTVPLAVSAPSQANDYESCNRILLESGIAVDAAATACSRALHPDQVAFCVADITDATMLAPESVLSTCSRDRRPEEVASCVISIHSNLELTDSDLVLESCRLSILPLRYSDCVVGLSRTAELATDESISYCISAGYRPEDVAPTFIFESN